MAIYMNPLSYWNIYCDLEREMRKNLTKRESHEWMTIYSK